MAARSRATVTGTGLRTANASTASRRRPLPSDARRRPADERDDLGSHRAQLLHHHSDGVCRLARREYGRGDRAQGSTRCACKWRNDVRLQPSRD